jgi:KDO2-lipid IV(A) lauroyltransferase
MVGLLPDQEPGAGQGRFAPFFGIPAYTMVLLARLAKKNGSAVFIGYAERLPRGRGYHLHFIPAPEGIAGAPLEEALALMNRGVEACARALPEQYQWSYKRFRTRPEGAASFYD